MREEAGCYLLLLRGAVKNKGFLYEQLTGR